MKYMGSKRAMLTNGLGQILRAQTEEVTRFADLFVGSSAVAWYVAENFNCQVIAADLQLFAVTLAKAVIDRETPLNPEAVFLAWFRDARAKLQESTIYREASRFHRTNWKL